MTHLTPRKLGNFDEVSRKLCRLIREGYFKMTKRVVVTVVERSEDGVSLSLIAKSLIQTGISSPADVENNAIDDRAAGYRQKV